MITRCITQSMSAPGATIRAMSGGVGRLPARLRGRAWRWSAAGKPSPCSAPALHWSRWRCTAASACPAAAPTSLAPDCKDVTFAYATTAVSFLSVVREVPAARASSSIPPCPSQRARHQRLRSPAFPGTGHGRSAEKDTHLKPGRNSASQTSQMSRCRKSRPCPASAMYQVAWAGPRICISRVHKRRAGVSGDMATGQASPGWARPPDHREGALSIRARRQAQTAARTRHRRSANC